MRAGRSGAPRLVNSLTGRSRSRLSGARSWYSTSATASLRTKTVSRLVADETHGAVSVSVFFSALSLPQPQGRLLYVDDPCADPNLAGEATAMPRRATFTCWRGVVAVDGGIVAWLARRKRARRKRTPERSSAQGVTSKVDRAGGRVGGRGRPVCLCPLNPTWRFKVAWRQKDHFVAPVRRLNRRPGVRRDFASCSCGIPMYRQLRRGPSSHTLT